MLLSATHLAVVKSRNDGSFKINSLLAEKGVLFSKTLCYYCHIQNKKVNYCIYCQKSYQKYSKSKDKDEHHQLNQPLLEHVNNSLVKFQLQTDNFSTLKTNNNNNNSKTVTTFKRQNSYLTNFFINSFIFIIQVICQLFTTQKQNKISLFVKSLLQSCHNFFKVSLIISTIAFIILNNNLFCTAAANKDAARLFEDLLADYNKLVRPVDNNSDTLVVKFKLKLSQLLDVVCNLFKIL